MCSFFVFITTLRIKLSFYFDERQASEDQSDEVMVEPPQDLELQMLIDRTASYVCRQNLEFGHQKGAEKIGVVKKLHKEKFAFLFPENKYNSYYLFKVRLQSITIYSSLETVCLFLLVYRWQSLKQLKSFVDSLTGGALHGDAREEAS